MRLEHNSGEKIYRCPSGACPTDGEVTLRLFVESFCYPESVVCIIDNVEISMHQAFAIGSGRMFECKIEMPSLPALIFYCFKVVADGLSLYYGNNPEHLGGLGFSYEEKPESLYQITVYDKKFTTPDWMKNAVVYQIFPDRFCRGKDTPFHGIERAWCDEPFYRPDQFGGEYLSNDFFGGNFDGIKEKLPYLSDMGITAIYLNPISKSFSNHRYDTGDYETPDELLGSVEDFTELSKEAEKLGIKIILDGVFSHTGADSKYFNKNGNYDSIGAFQSKDSPYFSWYSFSDYPEKYESWWGFQTLPNVNELDKNFVEYIAKGKNSVIKKWLRQGASGFRLDVADELPDEFIAILRKELKKENKDALLIGEVWEDASNKVSYGKQREFLLGSELDSVMNYVFRQTVLDFLTGKDASLFARRLHSLHENYPKESLYSAMNLLSSHDVPRALTSLADTPDFRTLTRLEQHDYVISPEKLHLAKRRMVLATALQMTLPGAPTVYYGDEAEMTGFADPFNRAPMKWDNTDNEIFRQIKLFANLRKEKAALRTGYYNLISADDGVICYMRSTENGNDAFGNAISSDDVIIIVNASEEYKNFYTDLGKYAATSVYDTLSGEKISDCGKLDLELHPLSYRIFTPERKEEKCIKIQSI